MGTGGRITSQGYGGTDNVRQKFTSYERDDETGLDYAKARYYSSTQGRFTGPDFGPFLPADPQSFNRYLYVQNNPLKFIDPTGYNLVITGEYAEQLKDELEAKTGYKLDIKDGTITIDKNAKRNKKGTSKLLANLLKAIIKDSKTLTLKTVNDPHSAFLDEGRVTKEFNFGDYSDANKKDSRIGAVFLAHVLKEGYEFMQNEHFGDKMGAIPFNLENQPHPRAMEFESKVLSELTGHKEQTRIDTPLFSNTGVEVGRRFEYTSIFVDIYTRNTVRGRHNIVLVKDRNCKCKKK